MTTPPAQLGYRPPTGSLIHQAVAQGVLLVTDHQMSPWAAARVVADHHPELRHRTLACCIREVIGL